MASVTDNFMEVATEAEATTLAAPGKAIGATSINVASTTGWPTTTGIIIAMRQVDTNGDEVAGTYTEWAGVVSGTTVSLGSSPSPLVGSDQVYPAGSTTQVYIPVSAFWAIRLIATLLQQHTQAGAHTGLTTDTLSASGLVTLSGVLKLLSTIADPNGNTILSLNAIASAVNNLQLQNAATGNAPQLAAVGSDTNIDLKLVPKGTGHIKNIIETLYNPCKFSYFRQAALSPTGVVTFDTQEFDTGSNYSTSTGKFTAPQAGFYQINAQLRFSVTANTQNLEIILSQNGTIVKNGSLFVNMYNGATGVAAVNLSALVQAAAGDYFQISVINSPTLALAGLTKTDNYFQGFLVSNA